MVWRIFRETLYAGHPLHRPITGHAHTVLHITREDVLAFYRRFYIPNNAIIVMVGALPETRMLEVVQRYLGAWPTQPLAPRTLPQPTPSMGKQVRLMDMEVNQSYLQLGHLSVRRADPNFAGIYAMNYILGGGGFGSRLMDSVRERQGLAYAVSSQFVGGSQFPGYFAVELQTNIPTTVQALESVLTVIEQMRRTLVTPEELADMKQFYEGSLPARAETFEQVAELLIDREFFGLPDGYWEAEIKLIQQLTAEDIQRLAQRYLDTDNFVLALVSKRLRLDLSAAPFPPEAIRDAPAP
jgi:zinc protease